MISHHEGIDQRRAEAFGTFLSLYGGPQADTPIYEPTGPCHGLCRARGGGFTMNEIETAKQAGFHTVSLGRRILRTETAALSLLSIIQYEWGDLNLTITDPA